MLTPNPHSAAIAKRIPDFYQAIAITRKHIQFLSKMANEKGQGRKKGYEQKSPDKCFGIPKGNDDRDAMKEVAKRAAAPMFRPGNIIEGRYIDPGDYEKWEQQRLERKRKNHKLDPYR